MSKTIRRFSRMAQNYDSHAEIQHQVFAHLFSQLDSVITESHRAEPKQILDFGCGTGQLTVALADRFKTAALVGLDPAQGMIDYANAHHPHSRITYINSSLGWYQPQLNFDLIFSNAAMQWCRPLDLILKQMTAVMPKNSLFASSWFGPQTFKELQQILATVLGKRYQIPASQFLDPADLKTVLSRFFKSHYQHHAIYERRYLTLIELLKGIHYTGTQGDGIGFKRIWTRQLISKLSTHYLKQFESIKVSYDIFYFIGRKL